MIPFDSAHQCESTSTDTNIVQKKFFGDDLGAKNRKLEGNFWIFVFFTKKILLWPPKMCLPDFGDDLGAKNPKIGQKLA